MKNFFSHPYLLINIIFAGVIILIFIYSGIFSAQENNHPIKCPHYELTGKQCPSCGISRSFSEIVRLKFESAQTYNQNGIGVFLFFFIQLGMRIGFGLLTIIYSSKKRTLIFIDSFVSIILFLWTFWEFIIFNNY
ncbi:MAG TPA: hypothetical protein DDX39_02805 [Bacteroidales bacterium]|nr:MAG: hypothetical protein A2265_04255 [Bacteroidetes bacterium RIFOXYA12_FULL_33_9]HBF87547.1 hypothetical protein [Bacteroidales bacterium]